MSNGGKGKKLALWKIKETVDVQRKANMMEIEEYPELQN